MNVTFETERVGPLHRGLVIDLDTFEVVSRTSTYASAETARSAAAGMWRAMQAETETLRQIILEYGTAASLMPHDVAAYFLCFRCAGDDATVRNMRETIIPSLRQSLSFGAAEIAEAVAAFDARFPVEVAA